MYISECIVLFWKLKHEILATTDYYPSFVYSIPLSTNYIYFVILSLQETWSGVLHHVCGEHTWATGQCKHNPIGDEANDKYLEKSSKALATLRKIVLDPKWLNTLHF